MAIPHTRIIFEVIVCGCNGGDLARWVHASVFDQQSDLSNSAQDRIFRRVVVVERDVVRSAHRTDYGGRVFT